MEFAEVIKAIQDEMAYQDSKYAGNDRKPFEIWLLIAEQLADDAQERYAHGTQAESRERLLKAVTCGIRALMSDRAVY
jgi:hypothetical protein